MASRKVSGKQTAEDKLKANPLYARIGKGKPTVTSSRKTSSSLLKNPLYLSIHGKPEPDRSGAKAAKQAAKPSKSLELANRIGTAKPKPRIGNPGAHNPKHKPKEKQKEKPREKEATPKQATETNQLSIKHAGQPPIVYVENLESGTTSEDVRAVFKQIGPIVDSRTKDVGEYVIAEVLYANALDAEKAVLQFNGVVADGRKLRAKISRTNIIPKRIERLSRQPQGTTQWQGPPLYSDAAQFTK